MINNNSIILFILGIFQFLCSSNVLAIERIWFIRHCDKQNDNNPCCSDEGYLRTKSWNSYFEKYIPLENKIKLITSDFSGDFVCVHHDNFTLSSSRSDNSNKKCQQSQRMYLTTHYLYESMKLKYSLDGINYKFCIRSGIEMIKSVLEMYNNEYDDLIVIWEHTEIIELIRFFDIYIKKWSVHAADRYDIIFMVSLKDAKLYVDYNQEYDNKSLAVNITDSIYSNWLHFDRISDYDFNQKKYRFYDQIIRFILITFGLSVACCVHCDEYIFYYYYNRNNRNKQKLHNKKIKSEKYYFNTDNII